MKKNMNVFSFIVASNRMSILYHYVCFKKTLRTFSQFLFIGLLIAISTCEFQTNERFVQITVFKYRMLRI